MIVKPLISIIVPVYNGEQFIHDFIEMIKRQTYKNWECILIDDGSTDNSNKLIIDETGDDDSFVFISQSNEGVSAARNAGLRSCNGDYVTFIDVDDYVYPDYLEYLFQILIENGADISACNCQKGIKKKDERADIRSKSICFRRDEAIKDMFYRKHIPGYAIAKLYSKKIVEHDFNASLKYGEDFVWTYYSLSFAEKVVYGTRALYFYYQNPNSATHAKADFNGYYDTFLYLTDDLWKCVKNADPNALDALRTKIYINVVDYCTRIWAIDESQDIKAKFIKYLKNNCRIVAKDKEAKKSNRMIAFIDYCFGSNSLIRICKMFLFLEKKGFVQRSKSV